MNLERDLEKITIVAGIDGSAMTPSIIDSASWASKTLGAPVKFLHVLEKATTPSPGDRSGAIGPGTVGHLLDELTELDEKRGKIAMELGKHMLEDASHRARTAGVKDVTTVQRHGDLLEALKICEPRTRLFVIGRLGEDHENHSHKLGAHLESLVRAIHTPIMVAVGHFETPRSFMIAYDGSQTANKAIARIARSALLKGMPGHVVMIGPKNDLNQHNLKKAMTTLASSGHDVQSHLRQGTVVDELARFREEHHVGLMVMGAYGHSRMREFFVGSNTSKMISSSVVPLLLLR